MGEALSFLVGEGGQYGGVPMHRQPFLGLIAALLSSTIVAGCGGDHLTLTEFGEGAEGLVLVMGQEMGSLDSEMESLATTVEGTKSYWDRRMEIRTGFLDDLQALKPPEEALDLHLVVIGLFGGLVDAEQALADRVVGSGTVSTPAQWWSTPEAEVALSADAAMLGICENVQSAFDETQSREQFSDTPWIPSNVKEVVQVAFHCSDQG
jgi:hypothetical protein